MEPTAKSLTRARDTVQALLEQLGLGAYLFEVEPRGGRWEVRVECPPHGGAPAGASDTGERTRPAAGWQSSLLVVDAGRLGACRTDAAARERLLDEWRRHLRR